MGICGTDHEIIAGEYGEAPPGEDRLIIGHESLGRVLEDPTGTLQPGDLVAGIVRHPDPVPCPNCAVGEWDMCRNGQYTEHGIKALPGFARDRWRVQPQFAVGLDPALAQVGCCWNRPAWWRRRGTTSSGSATGPSGSRRPCWSPGPGRSACWPRCWPPSAGSRCTCWTGPPAGRSRSWSGRLGATYHAVPVNELRLRAGRGGRVHRRAAVVLDVMCKAGPTGIVCLTGVSSGGRTIDFDAGALNRALVLENNVVFGSVNANRRHWDLAAQALAGPTRSG